jgi:hypothetical protein
MQARRHYIQRNFTEHNMNGTKQCDRQTIISTGKRGDIWLANFKDTKKEDKYREKTAKAKLHFLSLHRGKITVICHLLLTF